MNPMDQRMECPPVQNTSNSLERPQSIISDNKYKNHREKMEENIEDEFYEKAKSYWAHLPPTENSVLGGYTHISQIDIQGSRHFLQQLFKQSPNLQRQRALDCGAGIGRITRCLLANIFDKVDLVEQNPEFLKEAECELSAKHEKIGQFYSAGLQDFVPEFMYDLIWCQWVLGHLHDDHLVQFFIRCKSTLNKDGFIVVKENITSTGKNEIDATDSSISRTYSSFMDIFQKSGLKCFKKQKQMHFPKELYTVYMFALKFG